MHSAPVIVWFRDDLRLADNPALHAAVASGRPVVPLFILEENGPRALGGAARWWLAGSLRALAAEIESHGARMVLRRGGAATVLRALVHETKAAAVYFNRRYGKAGRHDVESAAELSAAGVDIRSFDAHLLRAPGSVLTQSGHTPKVFTPFWRSARALGDVRRPLPVPGKIRAPGGIHGDRIEAWSLEPTRPDWAGGLRDTWKRGEASARARLADFVGGELMDYARMRDRPDRSGTSRLSPRLRFGEISPIQVWHAVRAAEQNRDVSVRDVEKFLAELGWREFSWHLLDRFPDLAERNLQSRFDAFPWREDPEGLERWRRGRTGYPIVDAGMRELWHTGYMHNRVRMIAASFLVKHLLIDWREGERWFWDTLVDADAANNPASWQWVAGSGADAAPYFRIFNPTLQAEKFDPDGDYVRRWVPELAHIPSGAIHRPTPLEAPGYVKPIVDHKAARARALAAFGEIKASES